jgi:hypothetical protein
MLGADDSTQSALAAWQRIYNMKAAQILLPWLKLIAVLGLVFPRIFFRRSRRLIGHRSSPLA